MAAEIAVPERVRRRARRRFNEAAANGRGNLEPAIRIRAIEELLQ